MTNKIIIADDMEIVRKPIVRTIDNMCKSLGKLVEIDEVNDGSTLIEKVKNNNYAFIFTDNQMLNVHGLEAIIEIRKFNSTIPIYMLSSSNVKKEAIRAGATGYFNKVEVDEFRSKLKNIIQTYLK